ncbi:MAG: hypothetical protein QFX33_03330 [Candidatus Nezhaarchaeota archaeon]|nr:hypothetical protein [Candidatus Nezhaarchaeota archaeon]
MEKVMINRTVIVKSERLLRKVFRVFVELEGIYRNVVEQLTLYAVGNNIGSFTKLKALKYRELRSLIPSVTIALRLYGMSGRIHQS